MWSGSFIRVLLTVIADCKINEAVSEKSLKWGKGRGAGWGGVGDEDG